jgi:hypothetical protein
MEKVEGEADSGLEVAHAVGLADTAAVTAVAVATAVAAAMVAVVTAASRL